MAWLLALLPAAAGAAVAALGRRRPALLAPLALGGLVTTLALAVAVAAARPRLTVPWGGALELSVAVDGLAAVMVVLVPAVALAVVTYALAAERADAAQHRLVGLLVAFVGAMQLLVMAADLLTLLFAWELVGAASWALVAHRWRDPDAPRAAAQAFVTTRAGDLGLYAATGAAFAATGSFAFAALDGAPPATLHVVAAGVLLAAAAKSAQVPFAPWLFSAMAGPTPASALLHSATMVAAGAYTLARLAPLLAPTGWFLPAVGGVGLVTALAGGIVAALQTDVKRVLAGSTSAQYGLMLVAIGAGATAAAGAHLVTHAAFKALLFLAAGAAIHAAGTGDLARLRLGRALPQTALLAAVGAAALAAVPPLGAAFSKETIVAAAAAAGPALGAATLVAGLLSALYAGRWQLLTFGAGSPRDAEHRPGRGELTAMALLAGASIALGALWLPGGHHLVEALTTGRLREAPSWWLALSLLAVAGGLLVAWVARRRHALLTLGVPARLQRVAAAWFGLPALARVAVVDPVLALARALAAFDDRVVDAGVRVAVAVASAVSRILAWRVDVNVDAVVRGIAAVGLSAGRLSRVVDDRGVDGVVEASAHAVGVAGTRSRALQTGLAHHYYVIVAVGVAVVVVAAAFGR
jgi:NADH-quinone oxidoreductase subunit L